MAKHTTTFRLGRQVNKTQSPHKKTPHDLFLSLFLLELIDKKKIGLVVVGWVHGTWWQTYNGPFVPFCNQKETINKTKIKLQPNHPKPTLSSLILVGRVETLFNGRFGCWVEENFFFFHIGRDSLSPFYYNFRTWSRRNYQMKTRKTLDIKLILSFKPYHGCIQCS